MPRRHAPLLGSWPAAPAHPPLTAAAALPARLPPGAAPVGAHQDLPAHGLDLMSTALQAAGPALEAHESLMVLLQQDLVRAMFAAAKQPSLACLAGICQVWGLGLWRESCEGGVVGEWVGWRGLGRAASEGLLPPLRGARSRRSGGRGCAWQPARAACAAPLPRRAWDWCLLCVPLSCLLPLPHPQVALGLYVNLGCQMLLQVEALLALLLLPLAEGKGAHHAAPLELQQAALEGVLDFCAQPSFVRDAYLNLDCR